MREHVHYFRFFCRERRNHGLGGRETVIRNPEPLFADHDAPWVLSISWGRNSVHRIWPTTVNKQAFGKLRSQTYSKFSLCFSFRASVYVTVPQIPNLSCPATIF